MLLDALLLQTKLFLAEDMEISIEEVIIDNDSPAKLVLKDYNSMIGTGGKLNIMVVISFEQSVLKKLVENFMEGEDVDPEEEEEVNDSVSGEVINTIIGLALPTFPNRGKGVTITPPITINDAGNITKHRNSKIISAKVVTEVGVLTISAVGPEDSIK